jgi:hypothetical protein
MTLDIKNLTRFPILDMKEELINNGVKRGRHSEILRFFSSHLKDEEYYCISPYNPVRPKGLHFLTGKCSRTYLAGGRSNFFVSTVGEIEGYRTNIIVQRIYPRHLREFYLQESECVVYLSKKDIDRYVENCKK